MNIAVLAGGRSAERTISLASGKQVYDALIRLGHTVVWWDVTRKLLEPPPGAITGVLTEFDVLKHPAPNLVFIALHGTDGEDGTVQGFLELMGLKYTGSGVLASALAMDKVRAKTMFTAAGIPTPAHILLESRDLLVTRSTVRRIEQDLGIPCVVKPVRQGSSFGTTIVQDISDLPRALRSAARFDSQVMVEELVTGTEITVSCLGNSPVAALPIVEIVTKSSFFDYAAKYSTGEDAAEEIVPARLETEMAEEATKLAIECHLVLGCRGVSRTDMIVSEDGVFVLETNTLPGLTPTSLLPKAAAAIGLDFDALVARLVEMGLEK